MNYAKQTWANGVAGGTPINAARLNHMEDGIEAVDQRIDVLSNTIAEAENITTDDTVFTNVATVIPGLIITVPATEKNVVIEWGAHLANTGSTFAVRGPIYLLLYEVTDGGAVAIGSAIYHHSLGINYITTSLGTIDRSIRVGPADHDRIYAIFGQAISEAGAGVLAGATRNLPGGRSYLRAVA